MSFIVGISLVPAVLGARRGDILSHARCTIEFTPSIQSANKNLPISPDLLQINYNLLFVFKMFVFQPAFNCL